MIVRRLELADLPTYREVRLRALREHPTAFTSAYEDEAAESLESYARMIAKPPSATFGCFDGATLVGIAALIVPPGKKLRHRGTIVSMYVAPEARRTGAGRLLLQATIDAARAVGLVAVILFVEADNARAKALYLSFGFRRYGTDPRVAVIDGVYYDADLMILDLDS